MTSLLPGVFNIQMMSDDVVRDFSMSGLRTP